MSDDVDATVKDFILSEFLPGENPDEARPTRRRSSRGGMLDSIATLKLVLFIEEHFGIELEAHEVDSEQPQHDLPDIARLVARKKPKVGRDGA